MRPLGPPVNESIPGHHRRRRRAPPPGPAELSTRAERTNRPMPQTPRPRFGIMTAPSQVGYHDILRVWREADTIPQIEQAWLFDHLMPIVGEPRRATRAAPALPSHLPAH